MKQMKWFKRALSGIMTVLMLISAVGMPISAFAAETPQENDLTVDVAALPLLEEVADQLDEGERVSAEAYEMQVGTETNLNTDFTNINFDSKKVKVSFYEAKTSDGQSFSPFLAGTYQGVYYAEPYSGHPAYKFSRTITVVEPTTTETEDISGNTVEVLAEPIADANEDEDTLSSSSGNTIPDENMIVISEKEMSALLDKSKQQETTDWETGMTVSGVLIWASEEERINLLGMDSGETVSFRMPRLQSASTEYVSITKGENYFYETYGLGSYVTSPYYIEFGNVSAVAYCVQPALPGPGDGVYTIEQVLDNSELAKVIYYAAYTKGSQNFFDSFYPNYGQVERFIITHIAASYANGSSDAFTGANETAQNLAMQLYSFAVSQPEIPDMTMSFSNPSVKAYKDGDSQRTENVSFYADSSQSIVMDLPENVVFHNVNTGEASDPGANVTLYGGTTFYLSAPLSLTGDSSGNWTETMPGSISEDYAAYKITTGWDVQDLAFIFGETSQHEQSVSFSVSWLSLARIVITKTDEASGKNLAGAVFGVYSDPDCTNLIVQMPATDENGSSSVEITASQDTFYLKEITPPKGYTYTASALDVTVVAGQDSNLTITNKEIMGSLTIYKEGEVLTGATMTESGVTFQYENRRLPGAIYRVSAAEDIITADGTVVYRQGEVVADNLITGNDGSVTLSDLHLGTYAVTEIGAPKNYLNEGMTKKTVLTATNPSQEVVMETVTFENERQRVIVTAEKKDRIGCSWICR